MALPLVILVPVPQQAALSHLEYLLKLCVCEGKLPEERVTLLNSEDLDQRVDGVDTVLGAPAAARTRDFAAHGDLVLLLVVRLQGQLSRTILLHKVVP